MAQYKCVPAPKNIKVDKNGGADSAAKLFADIMNNEAAQGWKFHSMETLTVTEPSGCLSFITGNTITVSYNMLVFSME